MNQKEITELLSEVVSMYAPASARKTTVAVTKRLKLYSAEDSIYLKNDSYAIAAAALSACGTIVEQDYDVSIGGIVMSGSMNMNPAYIEINVSDKKINVKAYALEGLIKQNTAHKAISILKSYIG